MNPGAFDLVSRAFTGRHSRRQALRTAAAGLAGTAAIAAGTRDGSAKDATPAAGDAATDSAFLFVQDATGGTFGANPDAGASGDRGTPIPGGGADYLLTLEGHVGSTVYFSDRPERIFGTAPTQRFLDGLGFSPDNPPNAALVTADADGNEDVLVVELLAPSYDAATGAVTYGVNLLGDYEGGLGFVAGRQQDVDLVPSFGAVSLFIDDCSDLDPMNCYTTCFADPVGNLGERGLCWSWSDFECEPCHGSWQDTYDECNAAFPACEGNCFTNPGEQCQVGP